MARDYSAHAVNLIWFASLAAGFVICVGAAIAWRIELRSAVRPKAPIRGGRTTPWNFASVLSITLGFSVTGMLVPPIDENPHIVAIGSYLWLAIVPWFFLQKHVKAMTSS